MSSVDARVFPSFCPAVVVVQSPRLKIEMECGGHCCALLLKTAANIVYLVLFREKHGEFFVFPDVSNFLFFFRGRGGGADNLSRFWGMHLCVALYRTRLPVYLNLPRTSYILC